MGEKSYSTQSVIDSHSWACFICTELQAHLTEICSERLLSPLLFRAETFCVKCVLQKVLEKRRQQINGYNLYRLCFIGVYYLRPVTSLGLHTGLQPLKMFIAHSRKSMSQPDVTVQQHIHHFIGARRQCSLLPGVLHQSALSQGSPQFYVMYYSSNF